MNILNHIPPWVFIILAGLMWLGLSARKDREVRWRVPIIVPIALTVMAITSLYTQYGDTDLLFPATLAWSSLSALVAWRFAHIPLPETFQYHPDSAKFQLPGSYVPLAMYLGIFVFKFAVGFMSGTGMPIVKDLVFVLGISGVYGLFSGVFLSNAWRLFQLRAKALQSQ